MSCKVLHKSRGWSDEAEKWLRVDCMKSQSTLLNTFPAEIKEGVFGGVCSMDKV